MAAMSTRISWRRSLIGVTAVMACLASSAQAQTTRRAVGAAQPREFRASQFLRYVEDKERPRLEVSVMTLTGADGFTVDLVSAVHVADQSYFQDLNHRFGGYDAVLYEMVKHKDAEPPKPGEALKSASGVSMFQRLLTDVLKLSFQLDVIDYSAANFVHADLDVEAFRKKQEERGESLMGLMFKSMLKGMAEASEAKPGSQPDMASLLWALQQPDKNRQLKLILAKAFGDVERAMAGLDGPEGSAILTDRNDACLAVLRKARKEGKKRVAIFYGAAHMPDMAKKLVSKDRMKVEKSEWLTAWDLSPESVPSTQPAAK